MSVTATPEVLNKSIYLKQDDCFKLIKICASYGVNYNFNYTEFGYTVFIGSFKEPGPGFFATRNLQLDQIDWRSLEEEIVKLSLEVFA